MQSGFSNRFLQSVTGSVKHPGTSTIWLAAFAIAVTACAGPAFAESSQPTATETQLSASIEHTAQGSLATFTVHVSPSAGDANASGVVSIVDGAQPLASAVLNEDGEATIKTAALLPGVHSIHAVFAGTPELSGSLSGVSEVSAEAAGTPGFTATANPTTISVNQGHAGSTTITLTPTNGFSNYVSLSCSDLPTDTACTFLPTNVYVSGTTPTTSVLSIETFGPTSATSSLSTHSTVGYAFVLPALLTLAGLGLRGRRAWKSTGLGMLVFAGLILGGIGAMSGCSQRYHYLNRSPTPSSGTPYGSTTVLIQAQAVSGVVVTTPATPLSVVLTVNAPGTT